MPIKVLIIESEKDWGRRVDEVLEFETLEEAEEYCKNYNQEHSNSSTVPDWYMYATIVT